MKYLFKSLGRTGAAVDIYGLQGGGAAWFIGRAAAEAERAILCVTASEAETLQVEQDLALFTALPVIAYPGHEIPPYTPLAPDPATVATRLAALYQALSSDRPFILVASIESLLRKTIPRQRLSNLAELMIRGEESDPLLLSRRLSEGGYQQVALVQGVGEYTVRGGIIDLFPPGQEFPLRLDFFGDTVESIRRFDPISQRSIDELTEIVLLPARDILYPPLDSEAHQALLVRFRKLARENEWDREESARLAERLESGRDFPGSQFFLPLFHSEPVSPLAYLPADALLIALDHLRLGQALDMTWERIASNYQEARAAGKPALPPEQLFLAREEASALFSRENALRLHPLPLGEEDQPHRFTLAFGNHVLLKQQLELQRREHGLLPPLTAEIRQWLKQGETVHFACRSPRHASQMAELLANHGVASAPASGEIPPEPAVWLHDQPLSRGFDLPRAGLHWLSENELFGERRLGGRQPARRATPAGKAGAEITRFDEISPGDLVVHRRHGIGLYQGLVTLELDGTVNDYLLISYRGEDKLYLPVDQINAVGKYKGIAEQQPHLDRLGDKTWLATKSKIKKAVWQVAHDLLKLYAKRQLLEATRFSAPGELFHELEESFPFDETPGQLKAINEVLDDLCSDRPTDRLVCGDVGYGKTEVAVRAAFKVVEDGYQVALLVPTTVLAEQHAATFRERLAGFPVRVESLSRFRTPAEQKKIVKALAEGQVDIIIGTHRLLSADVLFKKLGLLIIDEEHRFGVSHKEKLKKLKARVDVLTLTATPIPRTLQLSLLGVRDLSVISSPPARRRTVKTFIARHDELVIKEAISRELGRGGQVFLVHNRVHSIHDMARTAQKLVPEARVAVAHGQMPGKQLEEIMVRFVRREVDVLVCTTIIESGLDIPSANTIIITRADRLGLAEIYQLRGRVGRSSEQAYAYLLVPSLDGLSGDAQQRLRALMEYNELGGGFKLAMSDLQIRGGGNILGESQSGNIAAVGYDLYLELLQKTVIDLKREGLDPGEAGPEEGPAEIEPEIKLRLSAHLPAAYIAPLDQRYLAYRRLTAAVDDEALADLQEEFSDRFGPLPSAALNLFEVIALKNRLARLGISKLEQGPAAMVCAFHPQTPVSPERIMELVKSRARQGARFTPEGRLILPLPPDLSPAALFNEIKKLLHTLGGNDMQH